MGTKKPRSLTTSGFFGVASIKDAQYGCGDGIWTSWPSGYEPDELPDCSTPRYKWCRKPGSNRYEKKSHGILSPGRLPIPPFRHTGTVWSSALPIYCITQNGKSQPLFKYFRKKVVLNIDTDSKMWYHIQADFASYILYEYRVAVIRAAKSCEKLNIIMRQRTSNAISNTFQNHNLIVNYNPKRL